MGEKINKGDLKLLDAIRHLSFLTVTQLAAVSRRSKQVIRRRLRALSDQALVEKRERPYGTSNGRPEDIYFLSRKGHSIFRRSGSPKAKAFSDDRVIDPFSIAHDLMVNWVIIHLIQIQRCIDPITIQYQLPGAYQLNHANRFSKPIKIPTDYSDQEFVELIPDGAFAVKHAELKKSLLFFIEVDMGTESLVSNKNRSNTVCSKIVNYQTLFRTARYKACEKRFDASFNGFRLLFVTNSNTRLKALNRLVRETAPSDFVWLTDQAQMFAKGISAKIWNRGGKADIPTQSILGPALACRTPVLSTIK